MAVRRALGMVLIGLMCGGAFGQVAGPEAGGSETAALLDKIIKDLGAEDVTLRLDAQQRLIDATSIRLRDIEAAAKRTPLTPEQCKRLLIAAKERFRAEPRAGMGVQSQDFTGERGVMLSALVPGFPASEVLRQGDRLLSVDGRPINDIKTMRPVVIAHDPGDEVAVVVVRSGATLNLKIRLGRFGDLNQRDRFMITTDILDEGWEIRSEEMLKSMPKALPAIESGLPADAPDLNVPDAFGIGLSDGGDPNLDPMVRTDTRRFQIPDAKDTAVAAAGEPRGDGSQVRWAADARTIPKIRVAPQNGNDQGRLDAAGEQRRQRQAIMVSLRDQQARLRTQIADLRSKLGAADEAGRKQINSEIAGLQRRVDSIERDVQTLMVIEP